ncbi:Gln-synt_C domain-containing protein [Meloidogyne graminicola]|uniref:Gln-synt_C domain-containing protein n=1 Tax=Meloidogyne graminicola TaxID=189291 RepID=A0A8S9ZF80_9BILA|nr:Gln-synt_C domain-containing protein [Meloidogyne graminicola]
MTINLEKLNELIKNGAIDTVVFACVDMQGRLIGKRLTGRHFLEMDQKMLNICIFSHATTIEGILGTGYELSSFETGFNDCDLCADLNSLYLLPWAEGSVLALANPRNRLTLEPLFCSPRVILSRQIERLTGLELKGLFASELEFMIFNETSASARQKHWENLQTVQPYNQWMNIGESSGLEPFMRNVRNKLEEAGVLLEAIHPEFMPSQHELNFVPADPMTMADRHIIAKHGIRDMAKQSGMTTSFVAKLDSNGFGSACHIHMSLQDIKTGKNAFYDKDEEFGMSTLARYWIAGLLKYVPEGAYFFAPYINSYKRLQPNTFAPTKCCWAVDNRTSGFRLCKSKSEGINIELRIGGADLNPYLAFSTIIAAGISGIEEKLELPPPAYGNIYNEKEFPEFPNSLQKAMDLLRESKMFNKTFGENVIRHYSNAASVEITEFSKYVTDWEIKRGFDRC